MKKLIALMAALVLALSMLAPMAMAEAKDNWLHLFLTDNPETLDVQLTTDSYTIPLNCFDRLVETDTVDGVAQIVPGLADSWDISEDGLTYTFHLHEGVTFHNGDAFTADDVVYTVNRMMDPEIHAYLLRHRGRRGGFLRRQCPGRGRREGHRRSHRGIYP